MALAVSVSFQKFVCRPKISTHQATSYLLNKFWMPDQVRYDESNIFYESIMIGINRWFIFSFIRPHLKSVMVHYCYGAAGTLQATACGRLFDVNAENVH